MTLCPFLQVTKQRLRPSFLLASLIILPLFHTTLQAKDDSKFFSYIENNVYQQALSEVLGEAMKRLGLKANFVAYPAARGALLAESNNISGVTARIGSFSTQYTHLFKVPVSIGHFIGAAVSTTPLGITNRSDLKNYRVTTIKGTKWSDDATAHIDNHYCFDIRQCLMLLSKGRTDVVLLDQRLSQLERKYFLKNWYGKFYYAPLIKHNLYPHLSERESALLTPLTEILEEMAASGEIEQIREKALERFFQEQRPQTKE